MTRIAVGGFLHETNTFAPTKATYADFVHGGGWPAMAHGADVLKIMRNINVGLAGFVEAGRSQRLGDGADHLLRRQPLGACHQGCLRAHRHGDGRRHRRPPVRSMRSISTCTAPW